MNKWIQKSIRLANSEGYLDKLVSIYPLEASFERLIPEKTKTEIKKSFQGVDKIRLLKSLLVLPKFPVDNPYVSALRDFPKLIVKNPKIIEDIAEKIIFIAVDKILELAQQPKRISRQYGSAFKDWLEKNIGYPFVEEKEFLETNRIAFFKGSDRRLKEFIKVKFGLKLPVDFVFKIENKFFIGQTKFITAFGGSQTKQFREAKDIAMIEKENLKGLAILDGLIWFESENEMAKEIRKFEGVALSALLLKEFIKSISKF